LQIDSFCVGIPGVGGPGPILPISLQARGIRQRTHRQGTSSMSTKQSLAFWELCRQGLPLLADAASDCWDRGKKFELEQEIEVAKSLKALIDQCNWEIEKPINSA